MRIDKVEIDGFGKLNNCSYTFSDGLNLIYGKNESGKSTICEFILSMFYGLPNKSKQSADDMASRIKFKPWNNESFGGRIYFTDDDGKRLVIERSFKATKRGDKAVLRDADTWEEIGDGENIGEKCFGLTKEAFLKTLYFKSFGADSLKSDDGEIMSRLSNLETSGDEDISYSKILNDMEKESFSLKTKTGRGGKITALEDKISALYNERTLSQMTHNALENDEKTAEELKENVKIKEQEAKRLEEKYTLALQYEKYLSQKNIEETKQVIENRLTAEQKKKEKLKLQLENLDSNDIPGISAETISRARVLETKKLLAEERLAEAKKNTSYERPPVVDDSIKIPAFFASVIILVGFFLKSPVIYISGLVFEILGFLVCLLINLKKRKDYEKEYDNRYNVYTEAKNELERINEELIKIFKPYGVSVSDELSALFVSANDKTERFAQLKKQYKECEEEIENLKDSIPKQAESAIFSQDVLNYSGVSAEKLFEMINILKAESKEMSERANEISIRIAKETAEIRSEDEINAELDELTEEKKELEKKHLSLLRALEWLNKAHTEIKSNFAPRLNQKASELLSFLTSERYEDMRANDNFGINLKATNGEIVEAEFMSCGTYDLIYIALRFASMSVLTDGKIPPVILDDAFSQLDDTRLLKSAELIKNNKEFSQVFLFSCHENYKEILKNCNLIELE